MKRGLEYRVSRARSAPGAATDTERSEVAYGSAALGFTLTLFAALALLGLIASFRVEDVALRHGLRAGAVVLLFGELAAYGLVHMRARGELRRFAVLELLGAAMALVLTVAAALRWGLPGAFAGAAATSVLLAGIVLARLPTRPSLSLPAIRRLLAVGFPLQLAVAVSTALSTADRLVVAALGGVTLLGYYAFGVSMAGLAKSLSWVVRTVIFPDVYGRSRSHGPGQAVDEHLAENVLPFARLMPPFLGGAALGIAPAVTLLLPGYLEAVGPARVFLLTGGTFGLVTLGSLAVVAASRQRALPLFSAIALALNLGLTFAALWSGAGLIGVAAGALLAQTVYAGAVLGLAATTARAHEPAAFVRSALAPHLYCAAVTTVLAVLFPDGDVGSVAAAAGLYVIAMLPLAPTVGAAVRTLREL